MNPSTSVFNGPGSRRVEFRLSPVAACCLGALAALIQPAGADAPSPASLPAFRVDPGLLGLPTPARPARIPDAPSSPAATVPPVQTAPSPKPPSRPAERERSSMIAASPVKPMVTTPPSALPAASAATKGGAQLEADRIDGTIESELVATGQAQLSREGVTLTSDRMVYRQVEDEVEAEGNVVLTQEGAIIRGPRLRMQLGEKYGEFDSPSYEVHEVRPVSKAGRNNPADLTQDRTTRLRALTPSAIAWNAEATQTSAHGSATLLKQEGENHYRLQDGTYSTCKPGDESWFARVADLRLDYDQGVGEGEDSTIVFKGVPILYMPWISFPLNDQRKSGFLTPTLGTSSLSGTEITLPYYWNIAPDMDATIAPRVFSKRGLMLANELRYLRPTLKGELGLEFLPGDQVRNRDRWAWSVKHEQQLGYGFSGQIHAGGVSDDNYYKDMSSRISSTSQVHIKRQGLLNWGNGPWTVTGEVLNYQTLQPENGSPIARPYNILPRLTAQGRQTLAEGWDILFRGQYTEFDHPEAGRMDASRLVMYPQLQYTWDSPGYYIRPKLGIHSTRYHFDLPNGTTQTYNRSVPILTVDTQATFERPISYFGRSLLQTLEPRLFYVYSPYRNQDYLTGHGINFDSGIPDFNFAQVFRENFFTGDDRVADANQLTGVVTSRLINPQNGRELGRLLVGQRLYFQDQQVTLNAGDTPRTDRKTDLLLGISGEIMPKTHLSSYWTYNPRQAHAERFDITGRYQPELGHSLSASYRYARSQSAPFEPNLKQLDFTGQWTLWGGWSAVGRYNYSLLEKRNIETIAGLEYTDNCWAARVILQRQSLTASSQTTAAFLQLELRDFSRIGSDPLNLLRRTIQGYGEVVEPASDPVFGVAR